MQLTLAAPGFELPAVVRAEAPRRRRYGEESQGALTLRVFQRGAAMTAHEAAADCRLTAREISRRIPELVTQHLMEPVTDDAGKPLKRSTPAGRMAQVWRVAK